MRSWSLPVGLAIALWWSPSPAQAGVNLKNGNFYITYTDVEIPGEMELVLQRTYNSQGRHKDGMWGRGWGSDLETYIEIRDDGGLIVHENGSGADSAFDRPSASEPTTEPGATWIYRGQRGQQRILRVTGGYLRTIGDRTEHFDDGGRLIQVSEGRAGHYYSVIRAADGRVVRLLTDTGHEIQFTYDRRGHVENLDIDHGRQSAQFRYEGEQLVWSRDASGNEYTYVYNRGDRWGGDDRQRGAMQQVRYTDGTALRVTHDGQNFVSSVEGRDGTLTEYRYYTHSVSPTEYAYGTIVVKDGTTSSYDYVDAIDSKGRSYVKRIARSKTSGTYREESSTDYNELDLPIREQRGSQVTQYRYDAQGRLTFKDDGAITIELEYHPSLNKLTRATQRQSGTNRVDAETRFRYNQHGELEWAENDAGLWTELRYDDKGRIASMRSSQGELTFEYNALGKPVVIAIAGTGTIQVSYDERGEILTVESPEGHAVALQVTQAFQQLLTLVKPANVGF